MLSLQFYPKWGYFKVGVHRTEPLILLNSGERGVDELKVLEGARGSILFRWKMDWQENPSSPIHFAIIWLTATYKSKMSRLLWTYNQLKRVYFKFIHKLFECTNIPQQCSQTTLLCNSLASNLHESWIDLWNLMTLTPFPQNSFPLPYQGLNSCPVNSNYYIDFGNEVTIRTSRCLVEFRLADSWKRCARIRFLVFVLNSNENLLQQTPRGDSVLVH